MERPLEKAPMLFFRSLRGLAKASFNRKDPSNPSRGSFQGSFRRTSLTVHSVYDSISKRQFADILKHMDANQRKCKTLIGFKLISYVLLLLFNIVIIKSGRKFENVEIDLTQWYSLLKGWVGTLGYDALPPLSGACQQTS